MKLLALAAAAAALLCPVATGQSPDPRDPAEAEGGSAAGEEAVSDPGPEAAVVKTGEHTYRLANITFDAKTREIRLPARVNLNEGGPMEYLLVHESGKVHESVLVTAVRPLHLQIVLKLLRYRAGEGGLFDAFLPKEEQRRKIEVEDARDQGDEIALAVSWESGGETRELPAANLILDAESGEAMTEEPWIYSGSHASGGVFLADAEGSIVGVYLDQIALLNMSREGAEIDLRWGANSSLIPEIGHPVTVTLRPAKRP